MKTAAFFRFAAMALLLIMVAQGAWALSGSGTLSDPYRIASASDWNALATNVNNGTTYSGKYLCLTADISVTNTMVGNSEEHSFRGTFDGRGHTLTISYSTSNDITAPFRYIQGATFKNLRVTGSITTSANQAAGIAGLNSGSAAYFDQCVTDITINSSSTTFVSPWSRYDYHGGFLARSNDQDVYITDSISAGSIDGSSATQSNCASFVGVVQNCTVHATRCLSTISYTNVYSFNSLCHTAASVRDAQVFYFVNGNDDAANAGEKVTSSQVADGSLITALQAGRATTIWVQYGGQPMQNIFAFNKAADGYYLIGSEQEWRDFSSLIYTIPTANARLTANISVTTMVGDSDSHCYSGTFDGQGHTLTVDYSGNDFDTRSAPFSHVKGATIRNLIVTGNCGTAGRAAGIVGECSSLSTVTNCVSSVTIDGGPYIGGISIGGHYHIEGCLFNGTINGTSQSGGFVGYGESDTQITNCIFAPQDGSSISGGTFYYASGDSGGASVTNSYYTSALGTAQGTLATFSSDKPANIGTQTAVYSVSGITAFTSGLYRNGQYISGSPEFDYSLSVTSASVMGESKYVTTFYHGTLDYQLPTGALAYTAGIVDGKVVFYRIGDSSDIIPKKTAVIIVASSSGPITLTKLTSTTVIPKPDNLLKGSDTDVTLTEGKVDGKTPYVLGISSGTLGFYPFTGSAIPAGKAYYVK